MLSNPRCKNQNVRFLESRMSFVGGNVGLGIGRWTPGNLRPQSRSSVCENTRLCLIGTYNIYVIYVPLFHIDTISGIPETN